MNLDIYAPGHLLYGWAQQMLAAQSNKPRSNETEANSSSTNQRSVGGQALPQRHHEKANNASHLVEQKGLAVPVPSTPKGPNSLAGSNTVRTSQSNGTTAPISSRTTDRPSDNAPRSPAISKLLLHAPPSPSGANTRELEQKQQQPCAQNDFKQSSTSTSSDNYGKALSPAKRSLDGTAKSRPIEALSTANVSSQPTLATDQRTTRDVEEKQPQPEKRLMATSRSSPPLVSTAQSHAEQKPSQSLVSVRQQVEEKKQSAVRVYSDGSDRKVGTMTMSTVLRDDEIADLRRFHDNSLAATTRKAYESDYQSFIQFLAKRFPNLSENQIHTQCTLEHVLAYLNQLCNDGKKISTINRRLSTIKKHILPGLLRTVIVPGSREEQISREMDAIVRGIRRTIGAEHRVRGKRPLLIENIIDMCKIAALTTDDNGNAMPNTRCRDVCLLLFLFFSAMRRNEVVKLLWSDLTFDARGVVVQIRQSKTDKEAKGQTIALSRLDGTERAAFCPVKALEAWGDKSKGAGDSPVFRWISKKDEIQWRVLIDQRIVAIIKHYAAEIGLDPACFAAHSTRSGYVTSSSDRGVRISEMMKRTRHKSISSISVYMKSQDLFDGSGDKRL